MQTNPARNAQNVILFVAIIYLGLAVYNLLYAGATPLQWIGWALLGVGFLLLSRVPRSLSFSEKIRLPLGMAAYAIALAGIGWLVYILYRD